MKEEARITLQYFLLLVLFIALMAPGKKNVYLLYHMPYAIILSAYALQRIFELSSPTAHRWATVLLGLYLLVNYGDTIRLIEEEAITPQTTAAVVEEFGIQPGEKVLATHFFIFNQLQRLDLQGVGTIFIPARQGRFELTSENFFAAAREHGREYIILDAGKRSSVDKGSQVAALGLASLEKGETIHGYRFLGQAGRFYVLRQVQQESIRGTGSVGGA